MMKQIRIIAYLLTSILLSLSVSDAELQRRRTITSPVAATAPNDRETELARKLASPIVPRERRRVDVTNSDAAKMITLNPFVLVVGPTNSQLSAYHINQIRDVTQDVLRNQLPLSSTQQISLASDVQLAGVSGTTLQSSGFVGSSKITTPHTLIDMEGGVVEFTSSIYYGAPSRNILLHDVMNILRQHLLIELRKLPTLPTFNMLMVVMPSVATTPVPSKSPVKRPTPTATNRPTTSPTRSPIKSPTTHPTKRPTHQPVDGPTRKPTPQPTRNSTPQPTRNSTPQPTPKPTSQPTRNPTRQPVVGQTRQPSREPTSNPTRNTNPATSAPTLSPTTGNMAASGASAMDFGADGDGDNTNTVTIVTAGLAGTAILMAIALFVRKKRNGTVMRGKRGFRSGDSSSTHYSDSIDGKIAPMDSQDTYDTSTLNVTESKNMFPVQYGDFPSFQTDPQTLSSSPPPEESCPLDQGMTTMNIQKDVLGTSSDLIPASSAYKNDRIRESETRLQPTNFSASTYLPASPKETDKVKLLIPGSPLSDDDSVRKSISHTKPLRRQWSEQEEDFLMDDTWDPDDADDADDTESGVPFDAHFEYADSTTDAEAHSFT